jgi:hypothetical protein
MYTTDRKSFSSDDGIHELKENILCVKHNLTPPHTKRRLFTYYSDVFEGVGRLEGQYILVLDDNTQPVAHEPRKVTVALKPLLKAELII